MLAKKLNMYRIKIKCNSYLAIELALYLNPYVAGTIRRTAYVEHVSKFYFQGRATKIPSLNFLQKLANTKYNLCVHAKA